MSQHTRTGKPVDLSRTGCDATALLDMRVEALSGADFATLRIDASAPGSHSSASYEMTAQEMRDLADELLQAADRVSNAAVASAFDRAYVISAIGVTPYITRARSSCDAIIAAQERHGVHTIIKARMATE